MTPSEKTWTAVYEGSKRAAREICSTFDVSPRRGISYFNEVPGTVSIIILESIGKALEEQKERDISEAYTQ